MTESSGTRFAETGVLTLDSRLAAQELGWESVLDWQAAVALALEWYHAALTGARAAALVDRQLGTYASLVEGSR